MVATIIILFIACKENPVLADSSFDNKEEPIAPPTVTYAIKNPLIDPMENCGDISVNLIDYGLVNDGAIKNQSDIFQTAINEVASKGGEKSLFLKEYTSWQCLLKIKYPYLN